MPEAVPVFGHMIDGVELLQGELKERRNPADRRDVTAQYYDGTPEIMREALCSAKEMAGPWAEVTRPIRGMVPFQAATLLQTQEWTDGFADDMVKDVGKTVEGARGEVAKTVRTLVHMAGFGTHGLDTTAHAVQSKVHMPVVTKPVGVAGAVTAFNFPLWLAAVKVAPALVAGCPVVLKPSPAAPRTSARFVALMHAAIAEVKRRTPALKNSKIGPGVLNLVQGGEDTVRALVEDKIMQALTFTGSYPVGKDLLRRAINREPPLDPKHMTFEMGGLAPVIVLPDANFEAAAKAVIDGAFGGEGERCTATKRLILVDGVPDDFLARVVAQATALKVGPGVDTKTQLGPLVSEEALEQILAKIEESVRNGMECVYGGRRLIDCDFEHGNFMEPAILKGDPDDRSHRTFHEEVFGPVLSVARAKDLDDAIRIANSAEADHRHAASIFTRDLHAAFQFLAETEAGMKKVNNPTLGGDESAGFGGSGGTTSFGEREMGPDALRIFLKGETHDISWGGGSLDARAR